MKTNRLQIIPIIAFIASFGICVLLLLGWNMINSIKGQIDENRLTLNELAQLSARSSDLTNRSTELHDQIVRVNNRFLTSTSALEFITTLEQVASARKVVLDLKTFDPPLEKTTAGILELNASGTLDSLISFIYDLESLRSILTIDTASFSLGTTSNRSLTNVTTPNSVVLNITGKTYWLPTTTTTK